MPAKAASLFGPWTGEFPEDYDIEEAPEGFASNGRTKWKNRTKIPQVRSATKLPTLLEQRYGGGYPIPIFVDVAAEVVRKALEDEPNP